MRDTNRPDSLVLDISINVLNIPTAWLGGKAIAFWSRGPRVRFLALHWDFSLLENYYTVYTNWIFQYFSVLFHVLSWVVFGLYWPQVRGGPPIVFVFPRLIYRNFKSPEIYKREVKHERLKKSMVVLSIILNLGISLIINLLNKVSDLKAETSNMWLNSSICLTFREDTANKFKHPVSDFLLVSLLDIVGKQNFLNSCRG